MALSNRDRIQKGLEVFRTGLVPFVERELEARLGNGWREKVERDRRDGLRRSDDGGVEWDTPALLGVILDQWDDAFRYTLGPPQRTLVHELREIRNQWAHERPFSTDSTYRALDSMKLLLEAVSAGEEAREVEKQAHEVMRTKFAEQTRTEGRRVATASGQPDSNLPAWRDVITPHKDVSSGRYEQAEFAADLAQVQRGEGTEEYRDPREFFQRTFLTDGLQRLLSNALSRLSGSGGDPVVELQTNFGGGKTHSMLALYHLFSGIDASSLTGVEPLLQGSGVEEGRNPAAQRAVLVGTSLSPGQAVTKPDGTVVSTLWGEMAYQLGGADAYAIVAEADASGTSPGSKDLADLFAACSPCLILIDEWVAYLRNLYGVRGLPAGSFESNVFFVQALTEAARAAPETLLVATLPASQIEIGGEGGEEALGILKNTFGRMESTWRPATAEEGFEIVRRRLFQESTENQAARDLVVKRFSEMYRSGNGTFPSGCGEAEYRRRLTAAYPIHPELFDRLYEDWAALEKFQRTRGVLRLMASVIHALWEGDDKNLLIMPSTVPMENGTVQSQLTRYMDDQWDAVIGKDVDGPNSLPLRLDRENHNLGRYSACRRVARTIYMGSAPTVGAANPGIEEKNILLGCAQPGESPPTFGDALRRLTDSATYLHVDGRRYWYSTQATITRLAQDRGEQLEEHQVWAEIESRLRAEAKPGGARGEFAGVHAVPASTADVHDEMEARLVILGPGTAHAARNSESPAQVAAKETLAKRGSSPRIQKNTLVFLAPDRQRLGDVEDRVRQYLAWSSIESEVEALNLAPVAARQAQTKRKEAETSVAAQIGETWTWCLVPEQPDPMGGVEWSEIRANGQDALAVRASKKLINEELLFPVLGPARLKMELDRNLWKEEDHVGVKRLLGYFSSFLYLPRLKNSDVLLKAIQDGISTAASSTEFAYAEGYDEEAGTYIGLRVDGGGSVVMDSSSVLVKPEVAQRQLDEEERKREEEERKRREREGRGNGGDGGGAGGGADGGGAVDGGGTDTEDEEGDNEDEKILLPNRVYVSGTMDPDRVGRDAGKIADEILSHLSALSGSNLKVSIEIEAEVPEGVPEDVKRTVSENAATLKLDSWEFDRE